VTITNRQRRNRINPQLSTLNESSKTGKENVTILVPTLSGPRVVATPQKNHEQEAGGGDGVIFWLRHTASKPMRNGIANEICLTILRGAHLQDG
jgi:hypothetical protein